MMSDADMLRAQSPGGEVEQHGESYQKKRVSHALAASTKKAPVNDENAHLKQRMFRNGSMIAQKAETKSAKENFRLSLLEKFGNFIRSWRLGMDFNGDLELSFDEFCTALDQMKFRCDVPQLWKSFDVGGEGGEEDEGDGCITLAEIDPPSGAILNGWRKWIYNEFGGPLNFFRELDKHKNNGVYDFSNELCHYQSS